MLKRIFQILAGIYSIGAIIWMLTVISTTILPSNNPIQIVIITVFGLSKDFAAVPAVASDPNSFEGFLYGQFLYNLYTFATIIVLTGLFTLTKGRNILEKYMLLQAYALPRERDYWGKIIDAKTGRGIPFAVVRLYSLDKDKKRDQFIAQATADLDGRYRLFATSANKQYAIEVKSPEYNIFTQNIKLSSSDIDRIIRTNIKLQKENEITQINIFSQFILRYREMILKTLTIFVLLISITTCLTSIYSLTFHFNIISTLNFVFYGFSAPWNIFVLLERRKFNPGRILNSKTQEPISNVTVKVFLSNSNDKAIVLLTDQSGIVQLDLDHEVYKAKIIKPGYALENSDDNMTEIKLNKDGYLKNDILLKPLSEFYSKNTGLLNPFGS